MSAVDLVHTAIVDMLLEMPHAESLAVVGYMNKQKKSNPSCRNKDSGRGLGERVVFLALHYFYDLG